jgi:sterol O-acyltransferase
VLRFGDRGIAYEDWWAANGFATFYRRWNNVVGGFLRNYVYLDAMRFSRGKMDRNMAQTLVFLISNVIHEIIVAVSAGYFYPILLVLFGGPGMLFMRLSERAGNNIFLWAMLIIGTGLLLVAYAREWYARYGLVAISDARVTEAFHPLLAPFIPRSILAYAWDTEMPTVV